MRYNIILLENSENGVRDPTTVDGDGRWRMIFRMHKKASGLTKGSIDPPQTGKETPGTIRGCPRPR